MLDFLMIAGCILLILLVLTFIFKRNGVIQGLFAVFAVLVLFVIMGFGVVRFWNMLMVAIK